jgi:type VI secretion system protein ImpG
MDEKKYFEREYNYLQVAGENFAQKHQELGSMLRLSEKQRKDPFVERLFEAFAFLSGRIHERLDDDMPEFTSGLLELLFPHFLRPFPSCAMLEVKPIPAAVTKPVVVERGSEVQTPPNKYKVKYKVSVGPQESARTIEKEESAEFIFRTTQELIVRPMRLTTVKVEENSDNTSSLILQITADQNVDFQSLDLKNLSIYLDGQPSLKYTLLLYLTKYAKTISVREVGSAKSKAQELSQFTIGIPGVMSELGYNGDDLAIVPFARETFTGYRLLQEYFCYPERFFFVEISGIDKFEPSGSAAKIEISIKFDRKLSGEVRPTIQDLKLNCVPIVNLFDRPTEQVSVTQRLPEYYITPDSNRRKSKEIYSVNDVIGVGENKQTQYTYTPVTSYQILNTSDENYDFSRFYSTVYRSVIGDVSETSIRVFGSSMEDETFPRETLSLKATMSNGFLPSKYLPVNSITQPVNFPVGLKVSNISVPSEVLPNPERKNYLWSLISHLNMSYSTLAEIQTLKTVLSLYNWSAVHSNPNQKKIDEGLVKIHPPKSKNLFRKRSLVRGIEFKIDIDSRKFENGEGDIHLFGQVLNCFLSQYVTINSFVILTLTDIETRKEYQWHPDQGKILPI